MSQNISNTSIAAADADEGTSSNIKQTAINDEVMKCCWVCFGTEVDDQLAAWVQPCNCIGTIQWVHQKCLQRWVDEKQRGDISRKVMCPQCKAEYIVVYPAMGTIVSILDSIEEVTHKVCPFVAAGVILGSAYWTAITYGAVTVMQVVGHKEGLDIMESTDPFILLILLPIIPVTLIGAKMYNWEDRVLLFLSKYCRKIPALGTVLPFGQFDSDPSPSATAQSTTPSPVPNPASPTRIFCSALLLPTISTLIGNVFFDTVQNSLHRTLLGGLTYIAVKGALKIYHKQMLCIRQSRKKILDYTDSNLRLYRTGAGNSASSAPMRQDSSTNTSRDNGEEVVLSLNVV